MKNGSERKRNRVVSMSRLAVVGSLLLGSTVSGCKEVDEAADCVAICDNYADCIDSTIHKQNCADACYDAAREEPEIAMAADECAACIDGKSCMESASCETCEAVLEVSLPPVTDGGT